MDRLNENQHQDNFNEIDRIVIPAIRSLSNDGIRPFIQGSNKALLMRKYVWWFRKEDGRTIHEHKFQVYKDGESINNEEHQYHNELLNEVAKYSNQKPHGYEEIKERHYQSPEPTKKKEFLLKTAARLIIGNSHTSVIERGITLHPYYGFPVIPSASIKGLVRHFCEENNKELALTDDAITRMFGDGGVDGIEGCIVFYEAWPDGWPGRSGRTDPILELDIINEHYRKYYRDNSDVLPTDNDNPNIIMILVVPKGISFRFALRLIDTCSDQALLNKAIDLVKSALKSVGIGAKTGSGYGYFE